MLMISPDHLAIPSQLYGGNQVPGRQRQYNGRFYGDRAALSGPRSNTCAPGLWTNTVFGKALYTLALPMHPFRKKRQIRRREGLAS